MKTIDVKHIAQLANLKLTEEEIEKFESQLSAIVGYIEKLNELDTSNVKPTPQVTGLSNVFQKDDDVQNSLTQEEAVSQAKQKHNGMFQVSQILEEK